MTRQITLLVNSQPISLDYFVAGFIDHTIGGMLEALEGTGTIDTAEISIEGETVAINLNNAPVPIKPFVIKIMRSTIIGMVSPLKGVSEISSLKVSVKR